MRQSIRNPIPYNVTVEDMAQAGAIYRRLQENYQKNRDKEMRRVRRNEKIEGRVETMDAE